MVIGFSNQAMRANIGNVSLLKLVKMADWVQDSINISWVIIILYVLNGILSSNYTEAVTFIFIGEPEQRGMSMRC